MDGGGSEYLSTRSEPWLDLDVSHDGWLFSWTLAIFSAAAMGHPERLQQHKHSLGELELTHTH